jgi:hypothetical protein
MSKNIVKLIAWNMTDKEITILSYRMNWIIRQLADGKIRFKSCQEK